MPCSRPRSRGAGNRPRPCQGVLPWPWTSAAPGLVLATESGGGVTGRGTSRATVIDGTEAASAAQRREREWWLRALAVFGSPRTAFSGLRDDSRDAAEARQEPVLALVLLAGIEGILATPAVGDLLDSRERDALVVAVLVFLAGMLYGVASYWIGGGALHLGVRAAGGTGSYRQARHVLAFAAAPLALGLLVLWP